jgi:hypothetical protein
MHWLICHPDTPSRAVRNIAVTTQRNGACLEFRYVISGDLARVLVPAPRPHGFTDRLWQHTCCELFLAGEGNAYREFNFSPSGEWAAYSFPAYRENPARLSMDAPGIAVENSPHRLELKASLAMENQKLKAALCAVIEEDGGRISYWALRHPAGKPDFHHRDAFALELG